MDGDILIGASSFQAYQELISSIGKKADCIVKTGIIIRVTCLSDDATVHVRGIVDRTHGLKVFQGGGDD